MPAIDADAHVVETERTWEFMEESEIAFKPQTLVFRDGGTIGRAREFWLIDGKTHPRRTNIGLDTSEATREMQDIEARLRHMDELEVDVQVLFPSLFLHSVTDRLEVQAALYKSYNRWLAEIWELGKGRLRWAVAPPLFDMDTSLAELHFGKEHGACAVFVLYVEANRHLVEPYFYPLYEEASKLDLPIVIHAGAGSMAAQAFNAQASGLATNKLGVVGAFHTLASSDIARRFPDLRRLRENPKSPATPWL